MSIWDIPVSWEMYGIISVESETLEQAMKVAQDEDGNIPLPANAHYVDGSWRLSSDEEEYVRLFQKQNH